MGTVSELVESYEYTDETGQPLFTVQRFEPKTFRQVPAGTPDDPSKPMAGVRLVPYQLPKLIAAVGGRETVYITEGERDTDRLDAIGVTATTSPGGAGKWRHDYATHFEGANVTIVADDDQPGREHARQVFASLFGVAAAMNVALARSGKDVSDHLDAGFGLGELVPIAVGDLEPWPVMDPIGATPELPNWPEGSLPKAADAMVAALAKSTQTDPRLAGSIALGVLSGAVAKTANITPGNGWMEPVNLWTLAIAETGELKSAIFKCLLGPLHSHERRQADSTRHDRGVAAAEQRAAVLRLGRAEKALASDPSATSTAEVDAAVADVNCVRATTEPRLITSDPTVHVLPNLLAENRGRIILASAEPSAFDVIGGRWSGNSGREDISSWLSAHSGDDLRVDRLGRDGAHVRSPALTTIITAQPTRLRDLGAVAGSSELGLLGRFMFSLCQTQKGTRRFVDAPEIPVGVSDGWSKLTTRLVGREVPDEIPTITLNSEARALFYEWGDSALEPRLGPDGDLSDENLAGWVGKYRGAVLRIAGVLHLGDGSDENTELTVGTLKRAMALGEYFLAHAIEAHRQATGLRADTLAARILAKGDRGGLQPIRARDLARSLKGSGSDLTTAQVSTALDDLTERGYLRAMPESKVGTPGRPPSPLIEWNPGKCLPNLPEPHRPTESRTGTGLVADLADTFQGSENNAASPEAEACNQCQRPNAGPVCEPCRINLGRDLVGAST